MVLLGWKGFTMLSEELVKEKRPPGIPRALRTRVIELKIEDYHTVIKTQGVIRPHNEISLTAQVSGQITHMSPAFEDGAFFKKGEILVELDPAVYTAALKGAHAQLAQANAFHSQEKARAKQARLNWNDLGYEDEPNELVLRLPQLREAEARVDSAAAQLERAQRDLSLTKIPAPFDGRVRQRSVGVSQAIGAGTPLGTVFAVDYAEVRLPIAARDMAYLHLPESPEDPPVEVELRDALTSDNDTVWHAKI
ncbi:MAG: efflux RND transporter periplasmic adaptor subunit, partial [Verrucomicrobiales bacterium]